MPFYKDNPVLDRFFETAGFDVDIDKMTDYLLNIPLMNGVKYAICLTADFKETKKGEKVEAEQIRKLLNTAQ